MPSTWWRHCNSRGGCDVDLDVEGPPYHGSVPALRRLASAAATAVLVTAAATACSQNTETANDPATTTTASPSATTSTPEPTATPTAAPPPEDGACYDLTADQTTAAHSIVPPVRCKARHTTQTYAVGRLSKAAIGDPAAVDTDAIVTAAEATCARRLPGHLDATANRLALSQLTYAWFVPPESQLALGARWLRCDVVARRTSSTLSALPRTSAGLLGSDASLDSWGTCAKGTGRALQAGRGQRICGDRHDWRAIDVRRLGQAGDSWPGDKAVRAGVLARCEKAGRTFTGNTTGTVEVGWLPPNRAQWKDGRRYGLCWVKTR